MRKEILGRRFPKVVHSRPPECTRAHRPLVRVLRVSHLRRFAAKATEATEMGRPTSAGIRRIGAGAIMGWRMRIMSLTPAAFPRSCSFGGISSTFKRSRCAKAAKILSFPLANLASRQLAPFRGAVEGATEPWQVCGFPSPHPPRPCRKTLGFDFASCSSADTDRKKEDVQIVRCSDANECTANTTSRQVPARQTTRSILRPTRTCDNAESWW
jgi:hypothetical protein